MKEVTQNLCRCQFFEFLPFSETRQLGDRVFYWAVFKLETIYHHFLLLTNSIVIHESVVITSHYHIVVAEELDTMQEGTENDDV